MHYQIFPMNYQMNISNAFHRYLENLTFHIQLSKIIKFQCHRHQISQPKNLQWRWKTCAADLLRLCFALYYIGTIANNTEYERIIANDKQILIIMSVGPSRILLQPFKSARCFSQWPGANVFMIQHNNKPQEQLY